jgi:hypothetical protein
MRASFDRTEDVLITGNEAVRGEAVGCIAWLDDLVEYTKKWYPGSQHFRRPK